MKLFALLICLFSISAHASWWSTDYVHGISQVEVEKLAQLAQQGKVLFIDTREPEEHQESHIPNSRNVALRDIADLDIEGMDQYEYVVPYCLKDFRGFEVARHLTEKGLTNVVLMEPAGLNGWRSSGLPLAYNSEVRND